MWRYICRLVALCLLFSKTMMTSLMNSLIPNLRTALIHESQNYTALYSTAEYKFSTFHVYVHEIEGKITYIILHHENISNAFVCAHAAYAKLCNARAFELLSWSNSCSLFLSMCVGGLRHRDKNLTHCAQHFFNKLLQFINLLETFALQQLYRHFTFDCIKPMGFLKE